MLYSFFIIFFRCRLLAFFKIQKFPWSFRLSIIEKYFEKIRIYSTARRHIISLFWTTFFHRSIMWFGIQLLYIKFFRWRLLPFFRKFFLEFSTFENQKNTWKNGNIYTRCVLCMILTQLCIDQQHWPSIMNIDIDHQIIICL